jgi:cupin 2 domain-containing protein
MELKRGNFYHVCEKEKHRIENSTPDDSATWLAIHYSPDAFGQPTQITTSGNIFRDPPGKLVEELINPLVSHGKIRIEQIVSRGHSCPEGFWYDQTEDEWVMVLKGSAKLSFESGTIEMNPGDQINIHAH